MGPACVVDLRPLEEVSSVLVSVPSQVNVLSKIPASTGRDGSDYSQNHVFWVKVSQVCSFFSVRTQRHLQLKGWDCSSIYSSGVKMCQPWLCYMFFPAYPLP